VALDVLDDQLAAEAPVRPKRNGQKPPDNPERDAFMEEVLEVLRAARSGLSAPRLSTRRRGVEGEIAKVLNEVVDMHGRFSRELVRVARVVGREGRMAERMELSGTGGMWAASEAAVNSLVDDLLRPTYEVARVISAVAEGDLSQKMALTIQGRAVRGEWVPRASWVARRMSPAFRGPGRT